MSDYTEKNSNLIPQIDIPCFAWNSQAEQGLLFFKAKSLQTTVLFLLFCCCFVAVLLLFCAAIWAPILNILLNNMALSDIRPHEYHPERYD